jgi:YHS domain-containing protein
MTLWPIFTKGEPVKGSKEFSTEYMGATFQFASVANRDAFLADPAAYAPQYGGYCAWAMADGKYAKGDAKYWKIVDGKLYLNYNAGIQKKWNADVPGFIEKADKQWSELRE